MANKERIREVGELEIRCSNHEEGCTWVGGLGQLENHLVSRDGCGYVSVWCTNSGCREQMERKNLETHCQEQCLYRSYECEHCGHSSTYGAIVGTVEADSHYSECPEYPLDCPNSCGMSGIRRKAMADHHSSCPLEPLDCPFKEAGCDEKIRRSDMENHMTTYLQKHTLQGFQSLSQQLQTIKGSVSHEISIMASIVGRSTNVPESIAQSLGRMSSILETKLNKVGDRLVFRVTNFPQLTKENKVWHSHSFTIAGKIKVRLSVHPNRDELGQGTCISLSLVLLNILEESETFWLGHNISFAVLQGRKPAVGMTQTLELCTFRDSSSESDCFSEHTLCSFAISRPKEGEVLCKKDFPIIVNEFSSLLVDDSMIIELKLRKHRHNSV